MANACSGTFGGDRTALLSADRYQNDSDRQLLEYYLAKQDEAAFVSLVRRYARSVWGVCRRVLRQDQDAEDAFQAVFLILARKAASIRKAEAVGSWLYGVAYRTATKARQQRATREAYEHNATVPRQEETPASAAAWRDLQRQLDEELHKLPDKYRAPFVLCYLEGMGRAEAARELRWKAGTVSSRLATARKILQRRLARRGVGLSAVLMAVALTQDAASAAAPAALVQTTATLASQATAASPAAAALSKSVLKTMALAKLKAVFAGAVIIAMVLGGIGLTAVYPGDGGEQEPAEKAQKEEQKNFARRAVLVQAKPPARGDEEVEALAISPNDHLLVTAGTHRTGHFTIWDADKGSPLVSKHGLPGVRAVAFSPDGKTLATGDFSGFLRLRDPRTGEERAAVKAHGAVNGIAFSADGTSIATAGLDRLVKIWDAGDLKEQKVLIGHADMVYTVAYGHDGKFVVSGGKDNSAIIWNLEAGQEKSRLRGHRSAIEMVAISRDDKLVATASWDQTIKLWDAATGRDKGTLRGHPGPVLAVAFSPDGKKLASADASGLVFLWELNTNKNRALLKHGTGVRAVAFSSDGKKLASGSCDGTAKVWDLAAEKEVHTLVVRAPQSVRAAQTANPPLGTPGALASAGAPKPKTSYAQEYYHSFKNHPDKNSLFEPSGPGAEQVVVFEPAGLRLTLSKKNPPFGGFTGVTRHMGVKGDFEITLGFELITEPDPGREGAGTGFGFKVDVEGAGGDHARLNRVVRFNSRLFTTYLEVTDPASGQKRNPFYCVPSPIRTGRLRMVRGGDQLAFYAAEGTSEDFQFIRHEPFPSADVKQIMIAAIVGGPQALEDVRILDLRVRADSLAETGDGPATLAERRSLLYVLAGGVALTLLLGAFWYLRQRRSADQASAKAPAGPAPPESSAAVQTFSLKCSHCGKSLRIKAELVGKKLKCPHCTGTVQAQATNP
jgi:RNA polymerase sigma factor (sigma-70 family)